MMRGLDHKLRALGAEEALEALRGGGIEMPGFCRIAGFFFFNWERCKDVHDQPS